MSDSNNKNRPPRNGGGSDRPPSRGRDDSDEWVDYRKGPAKWGSLGRKGAGSLDREDAQKRPIDEDEEVTRPPERTDDRWVDHGKKGSRKRPPKNKRSEPETPGVATAVALTGPEARDLTEKQLRRFESRLREAAQAYAADRYGDAAELLKPLSERFPSSEQVRELYGLTLYKLGRWKLAIVQLDAFQTLTMSYEQHHVLADCYRALRQHSMVEQTWHDLRDASPSGELVVEGRIVAAGSLADQGNFPAAIRLLQKGPMRPKRPHEYTFRLWYSLADLYEKAGDFPRAREQFRHLASQAPDFADARERADALS
jgi:Tetratricopeptide repeat